LFSRTRIAGGLIALSLAAIAPAAASSSPAPAEPVAQVACKSAVIVHRHKCIAAGQFCQHTKRANRDYHRYGYSCGKRDRNGRYHLVYY
jgi:hypothetical protein